MNAEVRAAGGFHHKDRTAGVGRVGAGDFQNALLRGALLHAARKDALPLGGHRQNKKNSLPDNKKVMLLERRVFVSKDGSKNDNEAAPVVFLHKTR